MWDNAEETHQVGDEQKVEHIDHRQEEIMERIELHGVDLREEENHHQEEDQRDRRVIHQALDLIQISLLRNECDTQVLGRGKIVHIESNRLSRSAVVSVVCGNPNR